MRGRPGPPSPEFPGVENKDGHVTSAMPVTQTCPTLPLPCGGARGAGEVEGAAPWPALRQGKDRSCPSLLGARWLESRAQESGLRLRLALPGSPSPQLLCPNQTNLRGPAQRPPGHPPHPTVRGVVPLPEAHSMNT